MLYVSVILSSLPVSKSDTVVLRLSNISSVPGSAKIFWLKEIRWPIEALDSFSAWCSFLNTPAFSFPLKTFSIGWN